MCTVHLLSHNRCLHPSQFRITPLVHITLLECTLCCDSESRNTKPLLFVSGVVRGGNKGQVHQVQTLGKQKLFVFIYFFFQIFMKLLPSLQIDAFDTFKTI